MGTRQLNLFEFSHRWTELDLSDRRFIILLLWDAIDWLLTN